MMTRPVGWTLDEIRAANVMRGPKSPEDVALMVEMGFTAAQVEWWRESRRRTDAFLEREAKRLRPGGGRPKNPVNRDALIYCLRECVKLPYYKIETLLHRRGLKVPSSADARYEARRAGKKSLNGRPCAHAELAKLLRK